jgi:hypothetical protein
MAKVQKPSNSEGRDCVGHLQIEMEIVIAYGRLKLEYVENVLPKITSVI